MVRKEGASLCSRNAIDFLGGVSGSAFLVGAGGGGDAGECGEGGRY